MYDDRLKVTFANKGYNTGTLSATTHFAIHDQENARKNKNLPHNAAVIANQDATSTLFIFLDDMQDQDVPDYVLFPLSNVVIGLEDGQNFETIFIKNTHGTNDVAAKAVKYNVQTIKRIKEKLQDA